MKYINRFNESVSSYKSYKNWNIVYNENNHDLDSRLKERSILKERDKFYFLIEMMIDKIEKDNYIKDGDYIFYFQQFLLKIIVNIEKNKKELLIVTFLDKKQFIKETNKIIIMGKNFKIKEEFIDDFIDNELYKRLKGMIYFDDNKWLFPSNGFDWLERVKEIKIDNFTKDLIFKIVETLNKKRIHPYDFDKYYDNFFNELSKIKVK